jgi:menaquinone-specific isochorismate synthase
MNDRNQFSRNGNKQQQTQANSGGAGVPPAVFLPLGGGLRIHSRRLPHWEVEGAVYFVTFRLADSLPKQALQKLDSERNDIQATASQMGRSLTQAERKRIGQLRARRVERTLDVGAGECLLRNPAIAQIVVSALEEFDGTRYCLFAWTVMPNHVHALFQAIGGTSLRGILHSWKPYSAKAANQILGRSGEIWQREYYDHLIRNETEFNRALRYVAENPTKAGLKNWPCVWSWR